MLWFLCDFLKEPGETNILCFIDMSLVQTLYLSNIIYWEKEGTERFNLRAFIFLFVLIDWSSKKLYFARPVKELWKSSPIKNAARVSLRLANQSGAMAAAAQTQLCGPERQKMGSIWYWMLVKQHRVSKIKAIIVQLICRIIFACNIPVTTETIPHQTAQDSLYKDAYYIALA